ncbi:unnamed protein product, partial [Rhizoctonia solani]
GNYLITRAEATNPIQIFQEDANSHLEIWLSRRIPTAADLEDARLQLSLLTERMRSEPSVGILDVPFVLSIHYLVAFVLPRVDEKFVPGVEDLFIPLLRETFGSVWRYLETSHPSILLRPELLQSRFNLLIIMANLMNLGSHQTDLVGFRELIHAIADFGVIEIMAKDVALTDENNGSQHKIVEHIATFKRFTNTIRIVSNFAEFKLDTIFRPTIVDWFKTLNHIYMKGAVFDGRTEQEEWSKLIMDFWYSDLGESLDACPRVLVCEMSRPKLRQEIFSGMRVWPSSILWSAVPATVLIGRHIFQLHIESRVHGRKSIDFSNASCIGTATQSTKNYTAECDIMGPGGLA